MSKKSKGILAIIVFIIIALASFIIFKFVGKTEKKYISYARASKMLSLLETDKTTLNMLDKNNWYDKYINYMTCKGYLNDNIKYNESYPKYGR